MVIVKENQKDLTEIGNTLASKNFTGGSLVKIILAAVDVDVIHPIIQVIILLEVSQITHKQIVLIQIMS